MPLFTSLRKCAKLTGRFAVPVPFHIPCLTVVMGTAMAYGDGVACWSRAFMVLVLVLSVHLLAALVYYPQKFFRAFSEKSLFASLEVFSGGKTVLFNLFLAFCLGIVFLTAWYLTRPAGAEVRAVVVFSVLLTFLYSRHRLVLPFMGYLDILLLITAGPFLLTLTYFLQSREINMAVVLAGLAPGFFAAGQLMIHNLKDEHMDRSRGYRTMVVISGGQRTRQLFLFFILAAGLVPVIVHLLTEDYPISLLAATVGLFSIPLIQVVFLSQDRQIFDQCSRRISWLVLFYVSVFSMGWIL